MLISYSDITIRLILGFIAGILVGYERYRHKKDAGMRTHAIVSVTATAITIISAYGFAEFEGIRTMDPARLIVGIITGIGFLGAGMIWKDKESGVHGLTTAANIWGVAVLGITIGLGHYYLSAILFVLVILALYMGKIIAFFAKKYNKNKNSKNIDDRYNNL